MTAITPETAANVLYYFGEGGYPAGSFTTKLMSAISNADRGNRYRLMIAFPELTSAMVMAMDQADGIARLRAISGAVTA